MQRKSILLAAVGALLVVGAFYQFALAPKRAELTKLDAKIQSQEKARDAADAQAAEYAKAKDTYDANYAKVVQLGKAVPADDDVRSLLVRLESTAGHDDVDFRLISVGANGGTGATAVPGAETTLPGAQVVPGSDVAVLPFSFGFRGHFFDLTDFMGKVDQFVTLRNARTDANGRLLLVTSFTIKPDDKLGFPNLRAEVGASSYSAPPATLPSDAAATDAGSAGAGGTATPSTGTTTPPTTTATATGAVR
jgi:hypothetical protein